MKDTLVDEAVIETLENALASGSLPEAAQVLADDGPALVERLLIDSAGVRFDRDDQGLAMGLEGAHSCRRILHVGDATGRAIMTALLARLADTPSVRTLDRHTAVDLLTHPHHALDPLTRYRPPRCHGAYVFDQQTGRPAVAATP